MAGSEEKEMMEQKKFYKQPNLGEFSAKLMDIVDLEPNSYGLILEETVFYPEGGGQPADTGYINDYLVIDVQEREEQIIHIINEVPERGLVGQQVKGTVNWQRRFDHMQQHSGQHILSAALYNLFQAETVGFHLGNESCQIDIKIPEFTLEMMKQAEILANERVFLNQSIETKWITTEEMSLFPIRKIPTKEIASARLVYIKDFDYSLCCGTHVAHTGEVGLIKIRNWERKNNNIRIDFLCGKRALEDYQFKNSLTNFLSSKFSAPLVSLENTIGQALAKSELVAKELLRAKQELYKLLAAQLVTQTSPVNNLQIITHILHAATPQEVTLLAKELLQYPQTIALLAGINEEQTTIQFNFSTNAEGKSIHMGQHLKNMITTLGGKGGGSAMSAQGGCTYVGNVLSVLEQVKTNMNME